MVANYGLLACKLHLTALQRSESDQQRYVQL
jgi:hypothetical protein